MVVLQGYRPAKVATPPGAEVEDLVLHTRICGSPFVINGENVTEQREGGRRARAVAVRPFHASSRVRRGEREEEEGSRWHKDKSVREEETRAHACTGYAFSQGKHAGTARGEGGREAKERYPSEAILYANNKLNARRCPLLS